MVRMERTGFWGMFFCWLAFAGLRWADGFPRLEDAAEYAGCGFALLLLFAAWRKLRSGEHWAVTLARIAPLAVPWVWMAGVWTAVFALVYRFDRSRFRVWSLAAGVWCILCLVPAGLPVRLLWLPLFFLLAAFIAGAADPEGRRGYDAGFCLALLAGFQIRYGTIPAPEEQPAGFPLHSFCGDPAVPGLVSRRLLAPGEQWSDWFAAKDPGQLWAVIRASRCRGEFGRPYWWKYRGRPVRIRDEVTRLLLLRSDGTLLAEYPAPEEIRWFWEEGCKPYSVTPEEDGLLFFGRRHAAGGVEPCFSFFKPEKGALRQ